MQKDKITIYIYKTTFTDEEGKEFYYFGKRTLRHTTPKQENYFGSGKNIKELLSSYSPEHFKKDILKTFTGTYEEIKNQAENFERNTIRNAMNKYKNHCLNMRISSAGSQLSEETRYKMSVSHIGLYQDPQTKNKISQTMKEYKKHEQRKKLLDNIFTSAEEGVINA